MLLNSRESVLIRQYAFASLTSQTLVHTREDRRMRSIPSRSFAPFAALQSRIHDELWVRFFSTIAQG